MAANELQQELEAKLENVQSVEEAIAVLAEAGIHVTPDQLREGGEMELSEDQLDAVAGGAIYYIIRKLIQMHSASSGRTHGSGGGHAF